MSFGSLPFGRTLFLDLDGVMADFDGAFAPLFGKDHRAIPDEEMWRHINEHGSYFRDLPPCYGALRFFERIRHVHPLILTACPVSDYAGVAEQKRGWVREHLGPDVPVLPVAGGKHKGLFLHRPGDILIDDFLRNIERWEEAGGVGILHTGDFDATTHQLLEALWQKTLPASGTSRAPSAGRKTISPATTTVMPTASRPAVSTASEESQTMLVADVLRALEMRP